MKTTSLISILLSLVTAAIFFLYTGCSSDESLFDGSRTSNDTRFILNFNVLNSTETHTITLAENDIIDVVIEKSRGELDISVVDNNEKTLYKGDNASPGQFSLTVSHSGNHKFSVTGRKAAGYVSFTLRQ
ncbi:MAG TPA: hypothetical protein PK315_09660 [Petrotogaceae bacterium]|nr:hypothetical protein [Fibrobacter sp.]HPO27727.1 hypothetical protein [Petrotogaceae bacterium]